MIKNGLYDYFSKQFKTNLGGGLFLLKFEAALFQNVISRDQKYRFDVNLIELGSVA